MDIGAVTYIQYINDAISTARKVMRHSMHSSLGGLQVLLPDNILLVYCWTCLREVLMDA